MSKPNDEISIQQSNASFNEKLFTVILHKLIGLKPIKINMADIEAFEQAMGVTDDKPGPALQVVTGNGEVTVQILDGETAEAMANQGAPVVKH